MWFGIVWGVLYLFMAISASIVYFSKAPNRQAALVLFGINGLLNLVWTFLFFYLKLPGFAFVELLFLLFVACVLIQVVFSVNQWAAVLLVPYVLWIIFAVVLNYSIYMLN
jgi:tryptophan-rich sensory protein